MTAMDTMKCGIDARVPQLGRTVPYYPVVQHHDMFMFITSSYFTLPAIPRLVTFAGLIYSLRCEGKIFGYHS